MAPTLHPAGLLAQSRNPCANKHYVESGKVRMSAVTTCLVLKRSVSVSTRLSSQQGLSFTEFTYQLLQAYDFYHLNKHFECTIQVGGSDQWGNIVAGLELIGKLGASSISGRTLTSEAFGITTPLLTTSSGEKFGKSSGNAVWLDPTLTSVFDFYQVSILIAPCQPKTDFPSIF